MAVLAVVVELGLRYVVARPQPVASAHEAAVDDAVRSTSLHALAGAGVAMLVWVLSDLVRRLADVVQIHHITDSIRWVCVTNTLGIVRFLLVGGASAWYLLAGPRRWQVKRVREREPAQP